MLIPFFLAMMPAFAGKVPDLSDGKDLGKYLEAQHLYGSGTFKRYPMSERQFVLMDWQLNWDFNAREAKKQGVVGDVDFDRDFYERATNEVYVQWREVMAKRGIHLRDTADLQELEQWKKSTAKFSSVQLDQRKNSSMADMIAGGHARFMVHPDGLKPYGKGPGMVVRMTKVFNSMAKELEPEGMMFGNLSISLCRVKNKKTKEKTLIPCMSHLGDGGSKSQRAIASFEGFTPMRFQATSFHRNEKYEIGTVGALVNDGFMDWGKTTDPAFLLIDSEVTNAPQVDFSLKGTFSEGEAEFVTRLVEVLLTADQLGWEQVQAGLNAAQAKLDKKAKKKKKK